MTSDTVTAQYERNASGGVSRRRLLGTAGLATIVAAISRGPMAAAAPPDGYEDMPPVARQILAGLRVSSRDALRGVAVMVMPGDDPYSVRQGVTGRGPGAMSDGAADEFIGLVDRFLPQGDALVRPVAVALSVTLTDLSVPAPPLPDDQVAQAVDRALGVADTDRTFPLSLLAGLVVDVAAVLAGAPLAGPFASPFANADYRTKCRAFELIERPVADLVAVFDTALPQPLRGSGAGLLRFVGGILLDGSAFTVWSEHRLYDQNSRRLARRPVAWDITRYRTEGLVDGHDDFIGYYRGFEEF
ncbi:hypothetical protein V1Y59_15860 [Gordonia sp. PKS22-38]|uniref:Uncharacterized protein n=1 Tax=Gordonia prachuapensis TaxID=3115651 RepID=A0ABU7MW45_9ACTN|nr:hypothetical protein [Gordonia sp. PKS22-38]